MPRRLEREVLLNVIDRCVWLIDYYKRTYVAPQSVQAFQKTMAEALKNLESLGPSVPPAPGKPERNQGSSV